MRSVLDLYILSSKRLNHSSNFVFGEKLSEDVDFSRNIYIYNFFYSKYLWQNKKQDGKTRNLFILSNWKIGIHGNDYSDNIITIQR